jgi:hypothetical protein
LGPDGFFLKNANNALQSNSSLMYLDTHHSSFLASEKIRLGRAHVTCAELR